MGLTAEQALGASLKKIKGISSGFDHATKTGDNTFSIYFTDGSKVDLTIPIPADGVSVTDVDVDSSNHLICTMSDASTIDAGLLPSTKVSVSKDTGNALVEKADGLYVSTTGVQVSAETGNTLITKADGLFVPTTDISGKVDKVAGKGLSTVDFTDASYVHTDNNYTTADKTAVGTISNKVDKVAGKGLSTNDYDATEKAEVAKVKDKLDANKVVTSFSATTLDTNVPSEKLVKGELDAVSQELAKKLDADKVVATFSATTSDSKVASEKLVKDSLDEINADLTEQVELGYLRNKNLVDGVLNAIIDSSGNITSGSGDKTTVIFYALENTKYTVSGSNRDRSRVVRCTEKPKIGSKGTIVINSDSTTTFIAPFDGWYAWYMSSTSDSTPQVEKGSVATSYVEPNGKSNVELTNKLATIDQNITDGFLKGNLWDEVWEVGGINNSTGINETDTENIRSVNYISIKPSNKYYIVGSVNIRYYFYDDSKSFISGGIAQNSAITSPSNAKYLRIRTTSSYGDKYKNDVSVFEGETPRSYIPNAKSNVELTRAIDDFDASMKMLGWTLPDSLKGMNYIDASGVFHQKIDRVDLGGLTWTLFKAESNIFSTSITGIQNTKYALMYSNIYNLANDKSVSGFANMDMRSSGNSVVVFIRNTSYSDADTFKSAMSGKYLYYELATEVTKSVDGNEATREKTLQTIACSVEPTEKSTIYDFQDDRLKNANMVILCFGKLGNNGIVCYETNTWHSLTSYDPDDPYWSSTLMARFNRSEGKVYFRVVYKGGSQTFENCKLTSVCYYN